MDTPETLCLGHDRHDKPNGCEKAYQCARHTALLGQRSFPKNETVIGCACVQAGYVLFVGLDEEDKHAA